MSTTVPTLLVLQISCPNPGRGPTRVPSMQPKGKSETDEDPHPWEVLKMKFQGSRQQYADERNGMWKKKPNKNRSCSQ